MPEKEPGRSCPVCVGAVMLKVAPSKEVAVALGYCQRCGGMWFDQGESELLAQCRPRALNTTVVLSDEAYRMACHSCQAGLNRNDYSCPACGWKNVLSCPVYESSLPPTRQDQLKLRCVLQLPWRLVRQY